MRKKKDVIPEKKVKGRKVPLTYMEEIVAYIKEHENESGIISVFSRQEAGMIYCLLL